MRVETGDIVLEGDRSDPQAVFWTKATHVPTGISVSDPVGFIRRNDLVRKLLEALAASAPPAGQSGAPAEKERGQS